MIRYTLLAALAASLPTMASAQYLEIFNEAEAAGGVNSPSLNTVASDGSVAYAITNGDGANDVGSVVSFDGSTFTTVSTVAQWQATGSTNDIFGLGGAGVVGNALRFIHSLDNVVYEVDLGTGAVSEVVSKAAIDAAAGVNANVSAVFETLSDGTIYSVESQSDQVLVISPGNAVSVEINTADFAAANGGTSIGGIGVLGDTVLVGSNSNDELWAWDTVANTASVVLTEAQIESATDDVDGNAGFGDIFAAPDGLVYFYESDSDFLLSYDPSDPAGTLSAVVTETAFNAGPGSDTINQLSWYNGAIAWTDTSLGYYTVPEPTTALLGVIALAGLAARRR